MSLYARDPGKSGMLCGRSVTIRDVYSAIRPFWHSEYGNLGITNVHLFNGRSQF